MLRLFEFGRDAAKLNKQIFNNSHKSPAEWMTYGVMSCVGAAAAFGAALLMCR